MSKKKAWYIAENPFNKENSGVLSKKSIEEQKRQRSYDNFIKEIRRKKLLTLKERTK